MSDPFDDRELCPDGACIGVIGSDGLCRECGTPGTRPAVSRPDSEPAAAAAELDPGDSGVDIEASAAAEASPARPGDDWDDRALCSDGDCIGVIGPDGHCRECGKPA